MNSIEITSLQNELVKFAVKLQDSKNRKKEKLVLLDGEKTIQGIIDSNIEFEYLFVKKDNPFANYSKINKLVLVNDEILKKISTTKTPTTAVGIIKEPVVDKNVFKNLKKIALIDGIKDAGNLGTIIRSAVAFSIDGIILFNDCVDLYNTKTIRATAQNMFKIPIYSTKDLSFIQELKKTHKLISTVVDSNKDFMNYKFEGKFIIAFGSEADGLSEELKNFATKNLTIEMESNALIDTNESGNVFEDIASIDDKEEETKETTEEIIYEPVPSIT